MKTNQLTKKGGLLIQAEQIARYKFVLNSVAFELLRDKAGQMNSKLPPDATGYDVWRGTSMDCFIQNLAIKLSCGKSAAEAFAEL